MSNYSRYHIGTDFKKQKATIRFGCLPFMIAMIVLICLKTAGQTSMSWWTVILLPIGLYWIYVILGTILFIVLYMIATR